MKQLGFLLNHIVCVCVLCRHMKIHEKDPNSSTAATPPSPLKRRRLSSKRKLSHDAESEKEDPAPAKKVSTPGLSAELPAFIFTVRALGRRPPKLLSCVSARSLLRYLEKPPLVLPLWSPRPSPLPMGRARSVVPGLSGFSSWNGRLPSRGALPTPSSMPSVFPVGTRGAAAVR